MLSVLLLFNARASVHAWGPSLRRAGRWASVSVRDTASGEAWGDAAAASAGEASTSEAREVACEPVEVLLRMPTFAVVNKPGSIPCHDDA